MHMFNVPTLCRESMEPVAQVDRPINALSMHIEKLLRITKGNNSNRIDAYPLRFHYK